MQKSSIVQEMLEIPYVPLIVQQVKQALAEENYRRQQFYKMEFPSKKVEFINGEIIIHSPVKKRHNAASGFLYQLLNVYVLKNQLGFVGHEKIMIALTRNDYEPDVCFFGKARAAQLAEDQVLFPAPDLIVEVLSSGTKAKDKGIKFADYQAHGISEYWMVDAKLQTVEKYLLEDDEYELAGIFDKKQTIESTVAEGFAIPVKAIFDEAIFIQTLAKLLN